MRHITYQFNWGFATYDSKTEQEAIAKVEQAKEYLDKFPVTIDEREVIDQEGSTVEVVRGELVVTPPEQDLMIPLSNEEAERLRGATE